MITSFAPMFDYWAGRVMVSNVLAELATRLHKTCRLPRPLRGYG